MRKILLGLAATISLLGTVGLASSADAAVTYEGTHDGVVTGHVDKSDVQAVLGWNEAKVQSTPVTFTTTFQTFTDTSWNTASGVVHNVKTLTFKQTLTASEVRGGAGNKIKGWDLTGMGGLEYVSQTVTGPRVYDGFIGGLNVAQDHALGDTIKVNGVDLPETPVATSVSARAATACATRAEFGRVRVGMAVPTTQQIIGGPGKVTMAGSFMSQRQWRACPGSGAYWVTLTYVNGRLDNKIML